jgi:amidohydrolase
VKDAACAAVDAVADELIRASHDIHARPELGYEERYASARLADLLGEHGVATERPAFGIETAFAGRAGSDGPLVVVCCEYDALPGIGHGCAHNVIGAMGVGAGIALAAVTDACGGRVLVLGTPAEELNGGGKVRLLEAGAFDGATAAMMAHPEGGDVERVPYLATDTLEVVFHGVAAHASSGPWKGVNALDALVLGYSAVSALRQQLRPEEKVHGIITDGGAAENTIPARAAGRWKVRARTTRGLEELKRKVLACFEGAAQQTGATLEHTWIKGYREVRANRALAAAYRRNGEALGRAFVEPHLIPIHVAGSTDMGDVSHVVPSIHPAIAAFPPSVPGHSEELARWAASEAADRAVVDGAKMLAMTAIDVWTSQELRTGMQQEHEGAS